MDEVLEELQQEGSDSDTGNQGRAFIRHFFAVPSCKLDNILKDFIWVTKFRVINFRSTFFMRTFRLTMFLNRENRENM